jgi:hypothetical protein
MQLRRFNSAGMAAFRGYLDQLASSPTSAPPVSWLEEPAMTEAVPKPVEVTAIQLSSRLEAGRLLLEWVEKAGIERPESEAGLWTWLSLLLFDSVCPPDGSGVRKPRKYNRHIAQVDNYQKRHRHLLLSPFLVYRAHSDKPERALAVLWQKVHTPGDVVTQITERQEYWSNRSVVEAATKLYYRADKARDTVGSQDKHKGGARRFADLLNQLDLNWYLYGMSAAELLTFLPEKEFARFKPSI